MSSEISAAPPKSGPRRMQVGIVRSDKRDKTITVEVRRVVKHAKYGKYLNRSTNYHAHDERNEAKTGDRVEISETRPLSKQKRWRLVRVVDRAAELGALDLKEVEIQLKRPSTPGSTAQASEKDGTAQP